MFLKKVSPYILFPLFFFSFAKIIQASGTVGGGITLSNPLSGVNDVGSALNLVINVLFTFAIPISVIMVIVGAIQILTAGGSPDQWKKGRMTILYAVIGFGIIVLARGIPSLIQSILSISP